MKKLITYFFVMISAYSWSQNATFEAAEDNFSSGKFEEAISLYDQASGDFQETGELDMYARCNLRISECHMAMGESKMSLVIAESAASFIRALLPNDYQLKARAMTIAGNGYLLTGRNDIAIDNLKKAADLYSTSSLEAAECYENLGVAYGNNRNKTLAIQYHERSLSIRQELETSKVLIADSYINIGLAYAIDEPNESIKYYQEALEIYKTELGERNAKVAYVYSNLAFAYAALGNYADALNFLDLVEGIWEDTYEGDHPNKAYTLNNRGKVLEEKGDHDEALIYQQEALKMYLRIHGERHPDVANTYFFIGSTYEKKRQYLTAAEHYQKAIYANLFDQNFQTVYDLPEVKDYYNADILLSSLKGKAQSLEAHHFAFSLKMKDIDGSIQTYLLCDELISQIRQSRLSEADKLSLGQTAFEIYDQGIKACIYLSEKAWNKKKYKNLAFNFCERSKSAVLLDAINETNAKNFGGVPSEEIQLEDSLKNEIATLEVQLAKARSKSQESRFKKELFEYQTALQNFISRLETEYPEYYNLKYSQELAGSADFSDKLSDEKRVISYFTGKESIYAFLVGNKGLKIEVFEKNEMFERHIKGLRNSITYQLDEEFQKVSKELYKQLVPRLPSEVTELVIIPDGAMGTIPFEALVDPMSEDKPTYLLHEYKISYDYSATLLLQRFGMETKPEQNGILLCAPVSFETNDSDLGRLVNTESEVKEIKYLFMGDEKEVKMAVRDEASESLLKSKEMSSYKYVHLATHGMVNESQPGLSRVYLKPDGDEDGSLYASEIYNIDINAELVTLSACETGIGKITKGEGIVGLSRALMYAGAENIIVSLWPVADKSTSLLMIEFYKQHLYHSDNNLFADDLRKAKLSLSKSNEYSDPYYWAPFILVGL